MSKSHDRFPTVVQRTLIVLITIAICALPIHQVTVAVAKPASDNKDSVIESHGAKNHSHMHFHSHGTQTNNSKHDPCHADLGACSKETQHKPQTEECPHLVCEFVDNFSAPSGPFDRIAFPTPTSGAGHMDDAMSDLVASLDTPPPKSS